jgi:hypothetical protein
MEEKKYTRNDVPSFLRDRSDEFLGIKSEDEEELKKEYPNSNISVIPIFEDNKKTIETKIENNYSKSKSHEDSIPKEISDASEIQGNYGEEITNIVLEKCSHESFERATSKSLSLAGYSSEKIDDLIKTEFENMSPRIKMVKLRNLLETKLKEYEKEENKDKYEATKMIIDITRTLYPEIE